MLEQLTAIRIVEVLIYYDGVRLFFGSYKEGRYYLALNVDQNDDGDIWLHAPITLSDYMRIKENKVYFGDFFRPHQTPFLVKVTTSDSVHNVISSLRIHSKDVPEYWLPRGDLEDQAELFTDNEEYVSTSPRSSLPAIGSAIGRIVDNLLPPLELAALRTSRPIADLRFVRRYGPGTHFMPVTALAQALQAVQGIVDAVAHSVEYGPSRGGKINDVVRNKVQLDAVAAFPSSFGIRLESRDASFLSDSLANQVFDRLVQVLSTGSDSELLKTTLIPLGPRVAARYKAFMKGMLANEMDFHFGAALPGDVKVREAEIRFDDASRILDALEKESASDSGEVTVIGILVGLSLRTKYYRIESGDTVYSGKISSDCLNDMGGRATVGDSYRAKIRISIEVKGLSGEEEEKFELIKLTPLSDIPIVP